VRDPQRARRDDRSRQRVFKRQCREVYTPRERKFETFVRSRVNANEAVYDQCD